MAELEPIDIQSMRQLAKDSTDPVAAAIWGVGAELLAALAALGEGE